MRIQGLQARQEADYRCSECGRRYPKREDLVAKRVVWREMGEYGATIRSRVVSWICKDYCLPEDPDWNRTPLAESPGFARTRLSRGYPAPTGAPDIERPDL